ncbi:MAG: hypothetical protein R2798_03605 [Chitinophagales bacterium]|nr:hypothetical protein [Bacteroidota bacterium]MCB9043069.1 hypothetical protein [Chitinophagales bacterium]
MDNPTLFYQESGKTNLIREVVSYIICIGLALILGYFYAVIIILIPVVYINFFITIGFGIGLGLICKLLARFSHNRNKKSRIIQAVIIGFLANYFQWTAYILYVYNGATIPSIGTYLANLYWIVIPQNFIAAITEINRVGTWSVFGIVFNGSLLTAVWFFEFAIIMAVPIFTSIQANPYPYSELLQQWYHKYTLFKDFDAIPASNELISELANDPLKTIDSLGKGTGLRHVKIHLFYLKDENKQYLTFEKIFMEGNGKENSSIIIDNLQIDNSDAKQLLEKYENKRERINVI